MSNGGGGRPIVAARSPAGSKFVAFVYENDYLEIQKLVQQYPNIETGGDLFGLWKNESTVVIQLFIGPGKNCKRTTTSFHQDIEYLHRVGSVVTSEEGLCNVGEWHSHHQIGMPEPSAADRRTVFNNMPQLGLERFVLFIATIETGSRSQGKTKKRQHDVQPEQVELRSFLFIGPSRSVVSGEIKIIPGANPHRHRIRNRALKEIENGAALPPNGEPLQRAAKSKSSDEDSVTGSTRAQQTNKSPDTKGHQKTAQEKPSGGKTLLDLAEARKETTVHAEQKRSPPAVSRETKPNKESGAVPQAQNNRDKESVPTGRKPEGDQQNRQRVEDQSTSKSRGKRNPNQPQATGGYNNENVSPNFDSGRPSNRGTQRNVSPPVSLFSTGNSQFWNPSPQTGTAQGRSHGEGRTPPPVSPLFYHSAPTHHSCQYQTRSGTQREKQVMPPSTTRDSFQSRGYPNDPQPTGRTAAGGHDVRGNTHSAASHFNEQMHRASNARQEQVGGGTASVDLGEMSGKGFF